MSLIAAARGGSAGEVRLAEWQVHHDRRVIRDTIFQGVVELFQRAPEVRREPMGLVFRVWLRESRWSNENPIEFELPDECDSSIDFISGDESLVPSLI